MLLRGQGQFVLRVQPPKHPSFAYQFPSIEDTLKFTRHYLAELKKGTFQSITLESVSSNLEENQQQNLVEYDQDLLRQQLLLLDSPSQIKDYIQTEALIARRPIEQLKMLSLGLMILAKEKAQIGASRQLNLIVGQRELMSRQGLQKVERQCLQTLRRVGQQRKRLQSCCICWINRSSMCLIPCMHMVLCPECAKHDLQDCPICKQPITTVRQIYQ